MRTSVFLIVAASLAAGPAAASVIFDFSGTCLSGDCKVGSEVVAQLQFTENAEFHHRNRSVSPEDFESLVLSAPGAQVGRVEVTWTNSPGAGILPIDILVAEAGDLLSLQLRDERKNLFEVEPMQSGGIWSLRFVSEELDVTLAGSGGFFGPLRVVSEPGGLAVVALWIFGLGWRRRPSALRRQRQQANPIAFPVPASER